MKSPNPEERDALHLAIEYAKKVNADIVLGTDSDCDRVGVAVRNLEGEYILLTGNQIGALLTNYIISHMEDIKPQDTVIKTIVTSDLGAKIAKSYGLCVIETLTGFKYIGEKIKEFESTGSNNFVLGYEESYGYLAGTFVRDKDAVIATMLIVEMAAYYKNKRLTLLDELNNIYRKYGFYSDYQESYKFEGIEGNNKIRSIMNKFRKLESLLTCFKDIDVIEDYNYQERLFIKTNHKEMIDLPKSNVIKIFFKDKSWFAIRPSGTEPKLKVYYSSVGSTSSESLNKLNQLRALVRDYLNN
ncbi:MAG: hypothetical protein GX323_10355 [Clostridiales bacterium]|nr:hypothetical protein [Clostridiales bacterium]